jgi:signal transduction histidine kinase
MACAFSKNDTQLHWVQTYIENQILAVLPLTKHLAPFYDALACSKAYSHGIQERTVQSLQAIAEVVGRLAGLLVLSVLTILHDAADDALFWFVTWLRKCAAAAKPDLAATDTVAQHAHDALCMLDDAFKALDFFLTDVMYYTLKQLLDSIAAQTAHMRTILYHCLSSTLRKFGNLFAEEQSPLQQALWQLIVDADDAVYSQWHLRFMLTNLWYANTSTLTSGLSALSNSVVSGWSTVVTDDVLYGLIPSDAGELKPGYSMLVDLLALFSYSDSSHTT